MEAFEQLTFKVPSYSLQIKIGRVLSLLQKQLDSAFTTKQAYDQQKRYLLKQMFIWTYISVGSFFASWAMQEYFAPQKVCSPIRLA